VQQLINTMDKSFVPNLKQNVTALVNKSRSVHGRVREDLFFCNYCYNRNLNNNR
jgi:hypothetical protein